MEVWQPHTLARGRLRDLHRTQQGAQRQRTTLSQLGARWRMRCDLKNHQQTLLSSLSPHATRGLPPVRTGIGGRHLRPMTCYYYSIQTIRRTSTVGDYSTRSQSTIQIQEHFREGYVTLFVWKSLRQNSEYGTVDRYPVRSTEFPHSNRLSSWASFIFVHALIA